MRRLVTATALYLITAAVTPLLAGAAVLPGDENAAIRATARIIAGDLDSVGQMHGRSSGSGVLISAEGLIVTNRHVIAPENGQPYPELWAGITEAGHEHATPRRAYRLKVVASDPGLDLALLKVVPKSGELRRFPFLAISPDAEVTYGSPVFVVGYPVAGGSNVSVIRSNVVGFDDEKGWITVEGSVMHGASGGAALNEHGEFIGIPTRVVADQEVPFIGDQDVPVGTVTLGSVAYVRNVATIRRFLAGVAGAANIVPEGSRTVVRGVIRDKRSGSTVPGAVVGVLLADTPDPAVQVDRSDLVAWAKSDFRGAFSLNRPIRPGKYLFKIVHPQYKTYMTEFTVTPSTNDLEIELAREE
jgi:S1-C subfamily serine protease